MNRKFFLLTHHFSLFTTFSYFIDDYVISFLLFDNSLSNNKLDIRLYLMQFSMYDQILSNSGNKITKDNLLTLSLHYAVNDRYTT